MARTKSNRVPVVSCTGRVLYYATFSEAVSRSCGQHPEGVIRCRRCRAYDLDSNCRDGKDHLWELRLFQLQTVREPGSPSALSAREIQANAGLYGRRLRDGLSRGNYVDLAMCKVECWPGVGSKYAADIRNARNEMEIKQQ